MSTLVIDASVAAKWFVVEAESPRARALLRGGDDLKAPSHLRVETASAILRAYRNGRFNRADAETALTSATQLLSSAAIELVPNHALMARAQDIAFDLRHAFADCLYVALAEREGADLITTDTTLLKRAAQQFPFVKGL